jgi:hypothetical protein
MDGEDDPRVRGRVEMSTARDSADIEREKLLAEYVTAHEHWLSRCDWWWPKFLLWLIRKTA